MVWASKFEAARIRAWVVRLACVALVFGVFGSAVGERPKNEPGPRDGGRGLGLATNPGPVVLAVNRVIMTLTSVGEIGASGGSVGSGGFWKSTNNAYIFSSGANVGAKLANGTVVFANGGPFSELSAGSQRFPELGVFWDSRDANDRANYPEVCSVDQARIDRFPALESFRGEPFPGFADQTLCLAVNDYTGSACGECAGTRVGVTIVETSFAFGVPTVQDFVFTTIRMFNDTRFINATNSPLQPPGPYPLIDTVFAFAVDADIGEAGDDQIAFLPDIQTMAFWDSDFNEPTHVSPLGFGGIGLVVLPVDPATGEELPLAEFTVFTNTGGPRPDPSNKEEWYQLLEGDPSEAVLVVAPTDVRGMVSTVKFTLQPDQFVEMGAAYFFAEVAGAPPADLRAEAYKNQVTGQIIPDANDDAAFANLRAAAGVAQASANAAFLQPVAPPSPDFTQIPGDHQITIVWDAGPTTTANPFARLVRAPFALAAEDAVATGIFLEAGDLIFFNGVFQTAAQAGLTGREVTNPNFNPAFAVFDFEGFRVYRSRTGLQDDAELIAQFDIANTFAGGLFCVDAVPVFDGDGNFIQNVCTATATLAGPGGTGAGEAARFGSNTGLLFSVIDRGGGFPNPSGGPGLINGIPVAHAVTSFGVNCGISLTPAIPPGTTTAPTAGCLTLESGKVFKLATPESNPSSLVGATVSDPVLVDGDNNELPRDPGNMPVEANALTSARIPAARDWDLAVQVVLPLAIPEDFTFFFRIDSMSVSPGFGHGNGCGGDDTGELCLFGEPGVFNELPAGDGRSWQIWFSVVDENGTVLQTPTGPAVGVFLTGFVPFNGRGIATSPTVPILAPEDPSQGTAFTVTYSTQFGERSTQCSLAGTCQLLSADGAGTPASVFSRTISRGIYGQVRVADVEITWSNQGGVLGLSSVHDLSNNVAIPFTSGFGTQGWGFARATGLAPEEAAVAPPPVTDDGKWLFPTPVTCGFPGNCVNYGFLTPFTQAAPVWTDLPFDPDIFAKLEPFRGQYAAVPFHQPGAFQETAVLANSGARKATRLWLAGHWIDVVFNTLPADGETWLIRFPLGITAAGFVEPPRMPPPGMAVKVSMTGGTSELAAADLDAIKVVPNPFIAVNEAMRGRGLQRILFTQLPPVATIRIYTISGNLVRKLEHTDGSGTEEFDVRTRFDLLLASGNYYYHVTTPDGRTKLGRFAVIN